MQRTNVFELKPGKRVKGILLELLTRSSAVYNIANYHRRQGFFSDNRDVPDAYSLQHLLKSEESYRLLGSGYSQQIILKNHEAWRSYFRLSSSSSDVSLPKYYKNRKTNTTLPHLLVCRSDLYGVDRSSIRISLPKDLKNKLGIKSMLSIRYNGLLRWKGKQGRGELKYDAVQKRFYFYQAVTVPSPKAKPQHTVAGVDLGVRNAITAAAGRDVLQLSTALSYERYMALSEKIQHYQSLLSTEWKNRHSSRRLGHLYQKRRRIQLHALDCYVSDFMSFCQANDVSTVAVGNIKHIRKSATKSRTVNRMINNFWSYDLLLRKLKNKCEEHGLALEVVDESYTSQTCPDCGYCDKENRPSQDRFICGACSFTAQADIVGATNILRRFINGLESM